MTFIIIIIFKSNKLNKKYFLMLSLTKILNIYILLHNDDNDDDKKNNFIITEVIIKFIIY